MNAIAFDFRRRATLARKMSVEGLRHSIQDALEAIRALNGYDADYEGVKYDEISVFRKELNRRGEK